MGSCLAMSLPAARFSCRLLHKSTCFRLFPRSFSSEQQIKKTALYDLHVSHGGKMVPFAGWSMPVQYKDSIVASHLHTRSSLSLFDVSHMLQLTVTGCEAGGFLEYVTVADVRSLKDNAGCYTVLPNEGGGIIDDAIVNKVNDDHFYVVANAGCADKDLQHLTRQLAAFKDGDHDVKIDVLSETHSLIALQGPMMSAVLGGVVSEDLSKLSFMTGCVTSVCGLSDCRVTRCGYTGEDGVEISVPTDQVVKLVQSLLTHPEVKLAGLGARDSLRLEAGLCLYGNDLNESTSPVEAALSWTISKRRKKEGGFLGSDVILNQLKSKPQQKRVGLVSSGPVARYGADIMDSSGQKIGTVTSGCPSPSLKTNVAMGYVDQAHSKVGTRVALSVRNRTVDAAVTRMPFVPTKYFFG